MHKDLSYLNRCRVQEVANMLAVEMLSCQQSLALTRQAFNDAFDSAAEELDGARIFDRRN